MIPSSLSAPYAPSGSLQHADHRQPEPRSPETKALYGIHPPLGAGRPNFQGQKQHGTSQLVGSWAGRLREVSRDQSGRAHVAPERAWCGAGSANWGCSLQRQRHHLAFEPAAPCSEPELWKIGDVPLPRGEQLAALQSFWKHVDVLMVDEMSFVSSALLERMDQHLRLARDMPHHPFGGLHVIFIGDLYQPPPPGGQARLYQHTVFFRLLELILLIRIASWGPVPITRFILYIFVTLPFFGF